MAEQSSYIEPVGFPVTWENPEDRELTWVWDDVHTSIPSTPLTVSVNELWSKSLAQAASQGASNRPRMLRRTFNGYTYSGRNLGEPRPEESQDQKDKRWAGVAGARKIWDEELLPTLLQEIEAMKRTNLEAASRDEIVQHLKTFLDYYKNHWRIHMQAVGPVFQSTSFLSPLYQEITGSNEESEPYLLLQGFDNKSLEVDRALRQLARGAKEDNEVAKIFFESTQTAAILDRLRTIPVGRSFIDKLNRFLETYGFRSVALDLSEPTWHEQPDFVLLTIKGLFKQDLEHESSRTELLVQERNNLTKKVLDQIGEDEDKRDEFLKVLAVCQDLWPIREDHAYYIEQMSGSQIRRVILECGSHLANEGSLMLNTDVFYLTLEELDEALVSRGLKKLNDVVNQRKAQREHFMKITPPQFLGKAPPEGGIIDNSETGKFVRSVYIPLTEERPSVLLGAAASPGKISGTARVIKGPAEFWRVEPGDILVSRSTTPPWTPLFSVIGGLVSDAGGVLSHGAIVAREYRLPAVMGTKHATSVIEDGQLITVDGDSGVVHLL